MWESSLWPKRCLDQIGLSYEVKILSIYDTYQEARKHERKAEDLDNSNIDTDPETLGRGYRGKKLACKRTFSMSTSSDEDELPTNLALPTISTLPEEDYVIIAENDMCNMPGKPS